jgi:mono/diheme cytochrome c family protein
MRARPGLVLLAGLALAPALRAIGDDRVPAVVSGSASFRTHCAVCHGADAKGEGPLADSLRVEPPDLTLIARRNGGHYPPETVRRIIDGRNPLKGHGGPEMPVWGDAFRSPADAYSEAKVAEKVAELVEYLRSIQASGR